MNPVPDASPEVPVDVLPPLPSDARMAFSPEAGSAPPLAGIQTFYHPASGVAILAIDLFCFGPEVFLPFSIPLLCVLAFLATFPLVYLVQLKWSRDTGRTAFGKAFLGAFLAGLPFSIAGTLFGAAVIGLSGLPRHPGDVIRKLFFAHRKLVP